jgi:hypothetical protein
MVHSHFSNTSIWRIIFICSLVYSQDQRYSISYAICMEGKWDPDCSWRNLGYDDSKVGVLFLWSMWARRVCYGSEMISITRKQTTFFFLVVSQGLDRQSPGSFLYRERLAFFIPYIGSSPQQRKGRGNWRQAEIITFSVPGSEQTRCTPLNPRRWGRDCIAPGCSVMSDVWAEGI